MTLIIEIHGIMGAYSNIYECMKEDNLCRWSLETIFLDVDHY